MRGRRGCRGSRGAWRQGVVSRLSGWMQSGPRACLLAVVEAAGNDPEGFAVVADLVDQAVP